MDFWYRVEALVRSLVAETERPAEFVEAWQELEEFLSDSTVRVDITSSGRQPARRGRASAPDEVHRALADLELSEGASLDEIKRAYRSQLVMYHPDRHLGDDERHQTASEVTRRLTLAYRRLCDYYG